MLRIHSGPAVFVAENALKTDVVASDMAVQATVPLTPVVTCINRKLVVEGCRFPPGGCVASFTGCREGGRSMIRVIGIVIIGVMTAEALRRRILITILVACYTAQWDMRPGERE